MWSEEELYLIEELICLYLESNTDLSYAQSRLATALLEKVESTLYD